MADLKTALVIGGAECVAEDFKKATALFKPDAFYAVNEIGVYVEKLNFWCTLHPEFMTKWEERRAARGLIKNYETVGPLLNESSARHAQPIMGRRITFRMGGMSGSGSSGLFAVTVALRDGYKVLCAGVPMTREGGHFLRQQDWVHFDSFIPGWESASRHFKDRVRSMSGWTMTLVGGPTTEWLSK